MHVSRIYCAASNGHHYSSPEHWKMAIYLILSLDYGKVSPLVSPIYLLLIPSSHNSRSSKINGR